MARDLRELIATSFGIEAAEAWSKFTLGEADKLVLHDWRDLGLGRDPNESILTIWQIEELLCSRAIIIGVEQQERFPGYRTLGKCRRRIAAGAEDFRRPGIGWIFIGRHCFQREHEGT